MLPTNKLLRAGQLAIDLKHNTLVKSNFGLKVKESSVSPQHLYICFQEEIKEGDWFLSDDRNHINDVPIYRVEQCIKIENEWVYGSIDKMGQGYNPDWSSKIIATTDSSLTIGAEKAGENVWHNPLPSISEAFIQKYTEMYNKGQQIKEVMVEYYETCGMTGDVKQLGILIPKLRNNEIIISKCKDTWNREEVEKHLSNYGADVAYAVQNKKSIPYYVEWFEQHF